MNKNNWKAKKNLTGKQERRVKLTTSSKYTSLVLISFILRILKTYFIDLQNSKFDNFL